MNFSSIIGRLSRWKNPSSHLRFLRWYTAGEKKHVAKACKRTKKQNWENDVNLFFFEKKCWVCLLIPYNQSSVVSKSMNCVKSGYFISVINIKTVVKHVLSKRTNVKRDRGQVQKLPTERHRSQQGLISKLSLLRILATLPQRRNLS